MAVRGEGGVEGEGRERGGGVKREMGEGGRWGGWTKVE